MSMYHKQAYKCYWIENNKGDEITKTIFAQCVTIKAVKKIEFYSKRVVSAMKRMQTSIQCISISLFANLLKYFKNKNVVDDKNHFLTICSIVIEHNINK